MIKLSNEIVVIEGNQTAFDDGLIQIGTEGGAPRSRKSKLNSWHKMTLGFLVQDGDSINFYAIWNKVISTGASFLIDMRAESNLLESFECQIVAGTFQKTYIGNGIHQWTGQVWVKPHDDVNDASYDEIVTIIDLFGWSWHDFVDPYDRLANFKTRPLANIG